MSFIYVIHFLYWNHLTDLIIHSRSNRSNKSNRNNSGDGNARPFVAVNAVVSVGLFDQNLDQNIDLGWPGLAWVKLWAGQSQKPWTGPGSSPGLGPGQALGKLAHLSFFRQVASKECIFKQFWWTNAFCVARWLQKGVFVSSFDEKGILGHFFDIFRNFSFWPLLRPKNIASLDKGHGQPWPTMIGHGLVMFLIRKRGQNEK